MIAVHPVLEGSLRHRVEPRRRRYHNRHRRRGAGNVGVVLHGAGDKIVQRPLAFYDAAARTMAHRGSEEGRS